MAIQTNLVEKARFHFNQYKADLLETLCEIIIQEKKLKYYEKDKLKFINYWSLKVNKLKLQIKIFITRNTFLGLHWMKYYRQAN